MLDRRTRPLLHELDLQCGFALKAYAAAAIALERRESEDFWYALQALLAAAAHLHQFLQTDPHLRSRLGVEEGSPLSLGELDLPADAYLAFGRWLEAHPRGPLRISNFGPFGVTLADRSVFARYLDTERTIAFVFGAAYDVPALLSAIAGLRHRVGVELRHLQEVV